jgi:hypothetical protein
MSSRRAAILVQRYNSGASDFYVSTKFAKLPAISIGHSLQKVQLGSGQEMFPDGEATGGSVLQASEMPCHEYVV